MRYLIAWSIALLALSSSCSSGNEYRAACQRVWDAGLITEEAMIDEFHEIVNESEYLNECQRGFAEMDPGERAVALALLEGPLLEMAAGLIEAFTEPPCTDLVDGQPVPAQFLTDEGALSALDCELDGSVTYGFMSARCEATGRRYYTNDYGWAYKDDKIFHLGDVPENCSIWYATTTTVAAKSGTSGGPQSAITTVAAKGGTSGWPQSAIDNFIDACMESATGATQSRLRTLCECASVSLSERLPWEEEMKRSLYQETLDEVTAGCLQEHPPQTTAEPIPTLSREDVLTFAHVWGPSDETVALQQVLGVTADGWYGPATQAAHIAELEARGLPTDNVPNRPPSTTTP